MANDKSLVIAIIGIVILAGAVTMVLRGVNTEKDSIAGQASFINAQLYGGVSWCADFSPSVVGLPKDKKQRLCDSFCFGWNGRVGDGVLDEQHKGDCCCYAGAKLK